MKLNTLLSSLVLLCISNYVVATSILQGHIKTALRNGMLKLKEESFQIKHEVLDELKDIKKVIFNEYEQKNQEVYDTNCTQCQTCLKDVSTHIITEVVHHIENICKNTRCPIMRRHCREASNHKMVAFGWILAEIRPMEKASAYCFGKGSCDHPGQKCGCKCHEKKKKNEKKSCENILAMDIFSPEKKNFFFEKIEIEKKEENLFPNKANSQEISLLVNSALGANSQFFIEKFSKNPQEKIRNFGEIIAQEMKKSAPKNNRSMCEICIRKKAKEVMRHAIFRIKNFCKMTKCPCMKKRCEMAKKFPNIARGMLIHALRPAEWSCGYCNSFFCSQKNSRELANHDMLIGYDDDEKNFSF